MDRFGIKTVWSALVSGRGARGRKVNGSSGGRSVWQGGLACVLGLAAQGRRLFITRQDRAESWAQLRHIVNLVSSSFTQNSS